MLPGRGCSCRASTLKSRGVEGHGGSQPSRNWVGGHSYISSQEVLRRKCLCHYQLGITCPRLTSRGRRKISPPCILE